MRFKAWPLNGWKIHGLTLSSQFSSTSKKRIDIVQEKGLEVYSYNKVKIENILYMYV